MLSGVYVNSMPIMGEKADILAAWKEKGDKKTPVKAAQKEDHDDQKILMILNPSCAHDDWRLRGQFI